MISEPILFPHKKELADRQFAYVVPLLFDRARVNVTSLDDPMGVEDFY